MYVYIFQDTTHIATKFKNLFLKPSSNLAMGRCVASSAHLQLLVTSMSKLEHGLCQSDLDNLDKMNYNAFKKITDPRVVQALKKIPDSESTEALLILIKDFVSAFVEITLSAEERLKKAWTTIFFMRLWRAWLQETPGLSSELNCLTKNTYMCMELNVHTLTKIVRFLRDTSQSDLLVVPLLSSQTCESLFRATRSMTSTYLTAVNFSLLELLHRLRRIELTVRIGCESDNPFTFPR